MRRAARRLAVVLVPASAFLVVSLLLAACAPSKTEVLRYRLTATLRMSGVTYVATAIQELQAQTAISYVTPNERGIHSKIRGQAAIMDIPGDHLLFLLRSVSGDPGPTIAKACGLLNADPYATVEAFARFRGPCGLVYPFVPIAIRVNESFDPATMEEVVYDGRTVVLDGKQGELTVTIEATDDDMLFNIDQLMPWLIDQRDPGKFRLRPVKAKPRDFTVGGSEFLAEAFQ